MSATRLARFLCYINPMGRPPSGITPGRSIRIGAVWDQAKAAAEQDGEKFAAFVERALVLELARRARRLRKQAGRGG